MDIPGVADDFSGGKGEEVGAAVPLFSLLDPGIGVAAAGNGFQIHAQLFEGRQDVGFMFNFTDLPVGGFDMDGFEPVKFEDDGFVHHAGIPVEEGEDHVEVDKGFRGAGEFLYDDMAGFAGGFTDPPEEEVDALGGGAGAGTDDEGVFAGYEEVASLHGGHPLGGGR